MICQTIIVKFNKQQKMDFYIDIIVLNNPIEKENFRKKELQMPILSFN